MGLVRVKAEVNRRVGPGHSPRGKKNLAQEHHTIALVKSVIKQTKLKILVIVTSL